MILEATSSRLQKGAPARDEPPPYSTPSSGPEIPQGGPSPPPPPRRVVSTPNISNKPLPQPQPRPSPKPRPSINQVHLQEKSHPISGTFFVDPSIPSIGFDAKGNKARKKNPPHASFRTRQGDISLDLGTTGDVSASAPKANILVFTRSGNISIKLLPKPSVHPRMALEVISRGGNIVLFVPKSFSGVVQLSTRKGSIELLPAFASSMNVLKESEDEVLVIVGDQHSGMEPDMNFCELATRSGKIVVGFSELDKLDAKIGFWKKLVSVFGGN